MVRLPLPVLLAAALWAQSAEEWRSQGLAHVSKGEWKLATPALEKACALETSPGDSCYYLARCHHTLNRFEAARKAFDVALGKAPAEMMSRVYRAAALNYLALGRNEDAERAFRRALAAGPQGPEDARVDLGAFLFREGRIAEASTLLEEAVAARPESARALLESGRVLLQLGKLEAAVSRLENAVRRDPANWNAHLLLGRAYQRMGRDADAERELRLGESEWRRKNPH